MDWNDYRIAYHGFLASLAQATLISKVSLIALDNYPQNLPSNTRDTLLEGMEQIGNLISIVIKDKENAASKASSTLQTSSGEPLKDPNQIIFSTLELIVHEMRLDSARGLKPTQKKGLLNLPALSRLACSQELVMIMAHLDAFIGQSLRAICKQRPEVLKTSQQVTWSDVIACKNWEGVLSQLTERFVYEAGWKSFDEGLEFLRKKFGLQIDLSSRNLKVLVRAEQLRHLLVHNGGRISGEYVKRTGKGSGKIGHRVYFPMSFVVKACSSAKWYGEALFAEISSKFFGIPHNQVHAEGISSGRAKKLRVGN